jgi:predicted ester cyclase
LLPGGANQFPGGLLPLWTTAFHGAPGFPTNQELACPVVKNALSTKASYNAPRYYRRLRAGEIAVTRDEAWKLAEHWIAAWNAHDLDLILAHYEDAIELTSPVAAQLLGTADGKVIGKANLKAYFRRGLEAYPELHFRLTDLLLGVSSVVLYYTNQKGTHTAEFMEFSANGKVARVVANYSAPKA